MFGYLGMNVQQEGSVGAKSVLASHMLKSSMYGMVSMSPHMVVKVTGWDHSDVSPTQ